MARHSPSIPGSTTASRRRSTGWRRAAGRWRSAPTSPRDWRRCVLAELGIAGRFAAVLGADSLAFRKPDPRHLTETIARVGGTPARSVLVGDTVNDREAARGAGVPCVLVGFGPEGDAVSALTPDAMIAHFDELPELLERLIPEASRLR